MLSFSMLRNRFVKRDGVQLIRENHSLLLFLVDYCNVFLLLLLKINSIYKFAVTKF